MSSRITRVVVPRRKLQHSVRSPPMFEGHTVLELDRGEAVNQAYNTKYIDGADR
jgi:hypothetical protein